MTRTHLSEADAGRAATVERGGTVEITLPEIPTTGYRWNWVLADGIRAVLDDHVAAPPGRPGQGGLRRLVVEVDRSGRHTVQAELSRPWEPDPRRVLVFELDATA